jgi:2-isopropylmalate synthase
VTKLTVHERQPYAGELVFTAFSGSHQDAIKKGLDRRAKDLKENPKTPFAIPYLTIDPMDIGRSYEAIIRINSQSGKGGVAYILEREFGLHLPKTMHPSVGTKIYGIADELGRELEPKEIKNAFYTNFVNTPSPMELIDYKLDHTAGKRGEVSCVATIKLHGEEKEIKGLGNGPINAFTHAIDEAGLKTFHLTDYRSHAVTGGSDSDSAAYIQLQCNNTSALVWGCGIDTSIELAGLYALVSAWNAIYEINHQEEK